MATMDAGGMLPRWLPTMGIGVAIGAAAVMVQQLWSQEEARLAADRTAAAAAVLPAVGDQHTPCGAVALVTGASPGTMGGCIAEKLAALGCQIAAVEHPLRLAHCEELCRQIELKYGVRAIALAADATDAAQVEASFVAAAEELDGEPSIVVSTVGGGGVAPDGGTRNGGTDVAGRPRTELAHEESWETT
jgi:hypothetical protein